MKTSKRKNGSGSVLANLAGVTLLVAVAVGLTFGASSAQAAVILIDGTAPDYLRNGSFETDDFWKCSGSTLAGDLGFGGDIAFGTAGSGVSDGSRYLVVSVRNDAIGAYQDTGYDLSSTSETFDLSFYHGLHSTWTTTAAEIPWQLFTTTTGDDTGTVDQVIASGSVTVNYTNPPNQVSYSSIGTVTSGSVGDRLFIAFTPPSSGEYFSVDEVNLSVIPEPASLGLFALVGGLLWFVRRRVRA